MTNRQANLRDAPGLARLRWEFSPEQAASGIQSRASFEAEFSVFLKGALKDGKWKIWVAEHNGRLIGNLYVEVTPKLPRPGEFAKRYGYMTNVYVAEEARNQGVDARLVEAARAWAKVENLEFLIVWPSAESVAFYRRQGFGSSGAMEINP